MIVATNPIQVKVKSLLSGLWLAYFLVSIGVVGLLAVYLLAAPLYLVSRVFPSWTHAGDRMLCNGVRLLMSVQPWLNAEIDLTTLPESGKGCLLVSNHRSHLDAFLLLSRIEGLRLLAKASLFSVPFLGWAMRLSHQIPAKSRDLGSFLGAMNEVRNRISRGEKVHVFPELTRCPSGFRGMLPFSSAPFHVAMQGGYTVVPIAISGTDDVWPKAGKGLHFGNKVRIRSLAPLSPRDFGSSEALMQEARNRIQKAIGV